MITFLLIVFGRFALFFVKEVDAAGNELLVKQSTGSVMTDNNHLYFSTIGNVHI